MAIIDLTHPLTDAQDTYPSTPPSPAVEIRQHTNIAQSGYNLTRLAFGSHQGTHMDAPAHFLKDGTTVDKIVLDRFYGPARRVDLAPSRPIKPGSAITIEMLKPHRAAFTPGARVIYRTGWDRHWGKKNYFQAYPSLTMDAVRWIVDRGIVVLGMDTPGPSEDWLECHNALLGAGIVIMENLCNLRKLPPKFKLIAFPLNLPGLDGSPMRAIAVTGS